ncbi:MAG TPA: glycosyltransferase [Solirubrobacteraceae bacterium]
MPHIDAEACLISRSGSEDLAAGRRIAVLTEMDPWSPSTRYRALQYVPRLRDLLGTVDVSLPGDTLPRDPGRVGQVRYFSRHAARYVRRGLEVRRLGSRYDALLVQRGLYPLGPGAIVHSLRGHQGPIVLDLDDALFPPPPSVQSKGTLGRWLYGPQQQLALLRRADAVVVSTEALAEMLPRGTPAPVILPTVPDPARYPLARHGHERPVVVGWAGTVGGLDFLDPLSAVLDRLRRERAVEIEVVCSRPWRPWASFRRWRLEDEPALFLDFAIGIMPLPEHPYARAKAGFKLLQYMAAGLPVVASPVGVNRRLVEESQAGFLADAPDEWEEALRELAGSPELRARMGASGRAYVERYADLDAHAATLSRLLAG